MEGHGRRAAVQSGIRGAEEEKLKKLYYKNGNVRFIGSFVRLKDGCERYHRGRLYREDGTLWMEGEFQRSGLRRGKEYDPSGRLMFEGSYIHYRHGEKKGPPYPVYGRYYLEDGTLLYDGAVKVSFRRCQAMRIPYVVTPAGRGSVGGFGYGHAGWEEKQERYRQRHTYYGRLPTFEEFHEAVRASYFEYFDDGMREDAERYFNGEEAQEEIRTEYEMYKKEFRERKITRRIFMDGCAGSTAYTLELCME